MMITTTNRFELYQVEPYRVSSFFNPSAQGLRSVLSLKGHRKPLPPTALNTTQ